MKIKAYIHAKYDEFNKKFVFSSWAFDASRYNGGAMIETVDVEFTPPPNDVLVNGTIAQYREMQKSILAEAQKKSTQIEQKISELLCIEYKESA